MFEKMKDHLSHHQINNSHYQDGVKIEPYFIDGNGDRVPYVGGEVRRITIETKNMNQLYFLPIGNAIYWSTNVTEINAFAIKYGELGNIEEGKQVTFQIPNVICIHKFNSQSNSL